MIKVTVNADPIKLQIGFKIALFSKLNHVIPFSVTKILLQCVYFYYIMITKIKSL